MLWLQRSGVLQLKKIASLWGQHYESRVTPPHPPWPRVERPVCHAHQVESRGTKPTLLHAAVEWGNEKVSVFFLEGRTIKDRSGTNMMRPSSYIPPRGERGGQSTQSHGGRGEGGGVILVYWDNEMGEYLPVGSKRRMLYPQWVRRSRGGVGYSKEEQDILTCWHVFPVHSGARSLSVLFGRCVPACNQEGHKNTTALYH